MIPILKLYFPVLLYYLTGPAFSQDIGRIQPAPGESCLSLTEDGAWCWFSDPRAVYFEGKYKRIYAGWIDHKGNVTVGTYDIKSKAISGKIIHENFEADDHDCPSLFITAEGKIMVYYSRHAGSSPIYLMISRFPENILEWEPRKELNLNDTLAYKGLFNSYTYTNICRLSSENKFYLFWRGMDFKPNIATSSDGRFSREKGKILILSDRIYKNRRPYFKICSDDISKIHLAFTDGHPRDEPGNSIYYAVYQNDGIYKANGQKIIKMDQLPLNPANTDMVYDANKTGEKAWIWDIAEDKNGRPVIVYVRFAGDTNHIYYYARWDGLQWNNYKLINSGGWFPHTPEGTGEREPNYSGGIVLNHENPDIVYLSVKRKNVFEIEKWTTADMGKSWVIFPITQNSTQDNIRPFAIRNLSDSSTVQLLWMNINKYIHYTDYYSSIKITWR